MGVLNYVGFVKPILYKGHYKAPLERGFAIGPPYKGLYYGGFANPLGAL